MSKEHISSAARERKRILADHVAGLVGHSSRRANTVATGTPKATGAEGPRNAAEHCPLAGRRVYPTGSVLGCATEQAINVQRRRRMHGRERRGDLRLRDGRQPLKAFRFSPRISFRGNSKKPMSAAILILRGTRRFSVFFFVRTGLTHYT